MLENILYTFYRLFIYHFEQFRKERKEERKLLSATNGVDLGGWRSPSTFNRAKSINSLTKHVSRANRAMNNQRFIHDHPPPPLFPPPFSSDSQCASATTIIALRLLSFSTGFSLEFRPDRERDPPPFPTPPHLMRF